MSFYSLYWLVYDVMRNKHVYTRIYVHSPSYTHPSRTVWHHFHWLYQCHCCMCTRQHCLLQRHCLKDRECIWAAQQDLKGRDSDLLHKLQSEMKGFSDTVHSHSYIWNRKSNKLQSGRYHALCYMIMFRRERIHANCQLYNSYMSWLHPLKLPEKIHSWFILQYIIYIL